MNNFVTCVAAASAMLGCGDNKKGPPAGEDSRPADAQCSSCPAAPSLGAQVDRMGRPAINTALDHGFDPTAGAATGKQAYNENAAGPTGWVMTYTLEFMKGLAIFDALDTGLCGNGLCETGETNVLCGSDCAVATGSGNGCGNQALYNGGVMGQPAMTMSYQQLAAILAADELYLDTAKTTCAYYLAIELGIVMGGTNTTCGGRAPSYDVMDFTLSMATMGTSGFNLTTFEPKLKDGASAHTDLTMAFPFLGPPHRP